METFWLAFGVLMRASHLLSGVALLGAMLYVSISPETDRLHSSFRHWLWWAAVVLVLSGVYNLYVKTAIPPGYAIWFGMKALLAMHVIAVSFLLARSSLDERKRQRLIRGAVLSGASAVLVAAYLRMLTARMQP